MARIKATACLTFSLIVFAEYGCMGAHSGCSLNCSTLCILSGTYTDTTAYKPQIKQAPASHPQASNKQAPASHHFIVYTQLGCILKPGH